jgi:glutamine cyclotransferase
MRPGEQKTEGREQRSKVWRYGVLLPALCWLSWAGSVASSPVTQYTVKILRTLPHNPKSFTQGLVYFDGALYESTGLNDRSSLQKLDVKTGQVLQMLPVPGVFAEGLARWHDRLIQLTWQNQTAFIYTIADFSKIGVFGYTTEGWGLTSDTEHLIMSDGTDVLYFRNPSTFAIERTLRVTFEGKPLDQLNELEYIEGLVYANVWFEEYIVQIDPNHGNVVGVIDARPLFRILLPFDDPNSVLNGIAYNPHTESLYLTGKNWPLIFEVTLIELKSS